MLVLVSNVAHRIEGMLGLKRKKNIKNYGTLLDKDISYIIIPFYIHNAAEAGLLLDDQHFHPSPPPPLLHFRLKTLVPSCLIELAVSLDLRDAYFHNPIYPCLQVSWASGTGWPLASSSV